MVAGRIYAVTGSPTSLCAPRDANSRARRRPERSPLGGRVDARGWIGGEKVAESPRIYGRHGRS